MGSSSTWARDREDEISEMNVLARRLGYYVHHGAFGVIDVRASGEQRVAYSTSETSDVWKFLREVDEMRGGPTSQATAPAPTSEPPSPAVVAEALVDPPTEFDFAVALLLMRQGARVRRAVWPPGDYAYVTYGGDLRYHDRDMSASAHFRTLQPSTVLASDWSIAPDPW